MDTLLSICIGIGLSAACGFRIFVPPLVMSMASLFGHLTLSPSFEWMGSYSALVVFAVATGIEIAAYYIPWVDNLLDTIATPMAIAAGTFVTASVIPEGDPMLQWTVALIAGGGAAGTIQAFTGIGRLASTMMTGGLGNPLISTIESGGSIILSGLAIAVPVFTVCLVAVLLVFTLSKLGRSLAVKRERQEADMKSV
ncbi:DUF4126 domain-containing protein [Microcoleus sp. FACHB-SPT15]|jgi:hypothetical protein|uniref:DUF4126 domain-containing protein n=1 Tax=Microcoleus sp. FACHB-SPT15 TaxID=2692830 RepID=UPI00177EF88D|nr:DUF4126 domain-containing protein [Microcoleus sp. FACHB-SPT15]MBD1804342.1 DUF4126 domain-containing protein [Microcoleus sp. FACHB-SPT15]